MDDLRRFCPRHNKQIYIFDCIKCPRFPLQERKRLERCLREFIKCLRHRRPRKRLVDCLRHCLAGLPRSQRRKLIGCILKCLRVSHQRVSIKRVLACANRCMIGMCISRIKRRKILACLRDCLMGFAFREQKFLLDDLISGKKDSVRDHLGDDFDVGEFSIGSEGYDDNYFLDDVFGLDDFDDDLGLYSNMFEEDFLDDVSCDHCGEPATDCSQ